MVDIRSCSLRNEHGAFKIGVNKSGWTVKKILPSCWQIFRKSTARIDDFITITGTTVFPQAFCGTGWVENKKFADKTLCVWENQGKIVGFGENFLNQSSHTVKALRL